MLRKSKSKKTAKRKADRYFSEYIRSRDTDYRGLGQCITCGEWKPYEKLDCGHFISRRFESTRYNEQNANVQCQRCNRFENGNQFAHGKSIDAKYGKGTADNIFNKSRMHSKRRKSDYERIAKKYYNKLKDLDSTIIN